MCNKKGILLSHHLLKSVANLAKMFAMYARHHVDHDSQIWSLDGTQVLCGNVHGICSVSFEIQRWDVERTERLFSFETNIK